ncbi:DUF6683 family protein [Roseateles sp. LYH14W]|uniref:DUF6683 family protein n=1 Tax=Pelomonas parva TaxID=3299032 RepID=A0ABW7F947_9BURK
MPRLHPLSLRALLAALALAAAAAAAQVAPSLSLAEQMRSMIGKPPAAGTAAPAPAGGAAPLIASGPPQLRQSATELAQRFPAANRAAMAKAFEESFAFWQKLETQLGLTPNDVGAATAAFIAGNYSAFMQQPVADDDFKALVVQMQGLLARSPAFMQSSPAARRAMFEQLAMVGAFMVVYREHLTAKPNPAEEANFRNTAKANLEAGLGLAVERIQIGRQGLVAR